MEKKIFDGKIPFRRKKHFQWKNSISQSKFLFWKMDSFFSPDDARSHVILFSNKRDPRFIAFQTHCKGQIFKDDAIQFF